MPRIQYAKIMPVRQGRSVVLKCCIKIYGAYSIRFTADISDLPSINQPTEIHLAQYLYAKLSRQNRIHALQNLEICLDTNNTHDQLPTVETREDQGLVYLNGIDDDDDDDTETTHISATDDDETEPIDPVATLENLALLETELAYYADNIRGFVILPNIEIGSICGLCYVVNFNFAKCNTCVKTWCIECTDRMLRSETLSKSCPYCRSAFF